MLNLSQIEAFIAVVDTRGFHDAAARLGCSQPRVSQQLRKLERALGVTLINRDRLQSIPTAQGVRLIPLARSLLRTAARAKDVVIGRKIVIGASSNIGIYLLPPYVARFSRIQGNAIDVDLRIAGNQEIAEALASREVDLALMEWWDNRSGFVAKKWHEEKLLVIVSPNHPWAKRRSVDRDQLFEQPIIGGEAGTGTGVLLKRIFGESALKIRIGMNVGSTEAVKAAVKAGLGISLVFASAVQEEIRNGLLCGLSVAGFRISKALFVVFPEDLPADAAAHHFARMLVKGYK